MTSEHRRIQKIINAGPPATPKDVVCIGAKGWPNGNQGVIRAAWAKPGVPAWTLQLWQTSYVGFHHEIEPPRQEGHDLLANVLGTPGYPGDYLWHGGHDHRACWNWNLTELLGWIQPDPKDVTPAAVDGWRPAWWGESPTLKVFTEQKGFAIREFWEGKVPTAARRHSLQINFYPTEGERFVAFHEPDSFTRELITKDSWNLIGLCLDTNVTVPTVESVCEAFRDELITVARRVRGTGRGVYSDTEMLAQEAAGLFVGLGIVETQYFLWEHLTAFLNKHHHEVYVQKEYPEVEIDRDKNQAYALKHVPQWTVEGIPLDQMIPGVHYVPWEQA